MALFKKKTVTTNIPELQEYYAAQKNDSAAKAWMLAIVTLLVTVAVLVGLFFAGRWTYRQLTKKKATTTTQTITTDTATSTTPSVPSSASTGSSTPSTTSNSSNTTSGSGTAAQGVTPTQSATTNTNAQAAVTTVPNTGPGNTVAVFAAVVVISYVAHRKYTLNKLSK